jgi:hypothetical protein
VIASSIVDVVIMDTLSLGGTLMAPLAPSIVAGILAAAIVLALIMDQIKVWLFAYFKMI